MEMKDLMDYMKEHGPEYYFKEVRAKNAAALIKKAGHLVVLTGAGISTESGIPDYRSTGGLWDGHKPEEISHWSKVGTPEFRKFFSERHKEFQEHSPNITHELLASWQLDGKVTIITQNIDGYHQRAGATGVIEMHGHMRHLVCDECGTIYDWGKYTTADDDDCQMMIVDTGIQKGCRGHVRPPVVLFGEDLPALEWFKAEQAVKTADVVLILGTSLQVAPFNELVDMAYNGGNGARIILATKSDTPYDGVASIRFREPIGQVMNEINNWL